VSAPVAILISGRGSNMVALVEAMSRAGAAARPVLVVSNDPEAAGLARAAALGVATEALDHRAFADRAAFDRALGERLAAAGAEIVACAGFMRILGPAMTGPWAGRILNIHPSLLPLFPGLDTHARALAAGVAVHGATVHEVTEALDAGPILGQAAVAVRGGDTADALGARVRAAEHALYPAVLDAFARDRAALRRAPLAQLRPDL
jgi:phosphoribosylglycinamide formyltransferase-1